MPTTTMRARLHDTALAGALGVVMALGLVVVGCGDSSTSDAEQFVGTWHYDHSSGTITCAGSDPFDATPTGNKTFGLGVSAALVDLTDTPIDPATFCDTEFDVSGPVATASTNQVCTVTGGDTVTIDKTPAGAGLWTFSLTSATTAEEKAEETIHITTAPVPPATMATTSTCAFSSIATLTRVAKE